MPDKGNDKIVKNLTIAVLSGTLFDYSCLVFNFIYALRTFGEFIVRVSVLAR